MKPCSAERRTLQFVVDCSSIAQGELCRWTCASPYGPQAEGHGEKLSSLRRSFCPDAGIESSKALLVSAETAMREQRGMLTDGVPSRRTFVMGTP